MAIIVEHLDNGNEYVLLGVGLGVDPGNPSTRFLKSFLPHKVAVCDRNGQIFWLPSSEVVVVEIDGQKPTELLPEPEAVTPHVVQSSTFDATELGSTELDSGTSGSSPAVTSLDDFEDDGDWL